MDDHSVGQAVAAYVADRDGSRELADQDVGVADEASAILLSCMVLESIEKVIKCLVWLVYLVLVFSTRFARSRLCCGM